MPTYLAGFSVYVSRDIYQRLKAEAAEQGRTLSSYAAHVLKQSLADPSSKRARAVPIRVAPALPDFPDDGVFRVHGGLPPLPIEALHDIHDPDDKRLYAGVTTEDELSDLRKVNAAREERGYRMIGFLEWKRGGPTWNPPDP